MHLTDEMMDEDAVVSIGSFHAKQSSQYQSFNIHPHSAINKYYFHQSSSYTPFTQQGVSANINGDEDDDQRIEAIREMCCGMIGQPNQNRDYYSDSQL